MSAYFIIPVWLASNCVWGFFQLTDPIADYNMELQNNVQ